MVYQVEKTLKESGDKVSDDVRNEVQAALDEARKAVESGEVASIKSATEKLERTTHRMAEQIYKSGGGAEGQAAPAPDTGSGAENQEEIIDAEVVETDEAR